MEPAFFFLEFRVSLPVVYGIFMDEKIDGGAGDEADGVDEGE